MARWLAAAWSFSVSCAALAQQPSCPPTGDNDRVALVLSGGGARALAHIGVLEVLDSLNVRPDLVVGTSMGAIVGALYASGYSGKQIDSIARTLHLAQLLRSQPPRIPVSLTGIHPVVELVQGAKGFTLETLARRQGTINALLASLLLRGDLLARGDFDSMPIPFIAVATDLDNRQPVVLDHGDLAEAVRASYSVPIVFSPVHMQGHVLVDGGISDNVPVGVARSDGATRVIVSDLTRSDSTVNPDSPLDVSGRLIDFLFEQPLDSLGSDDVRILSPVDNVGSLAFAPSDLDRAVAVGRRTAGRVLGPIAACLPHADTPLNLSVPNFLTRLTASRGREAQVLEQSLNLDPGHSFNEHALAHALSRVTESERYDAVWLNPSGTSDSVAFDARVDRGPRRRAAIGLAYDEDVGGRIWLGTYGHPLTDYDLTAGAFVQAGALREMAQIGVRGAGGIITPAFTATYQQDEIRSYTPTQHVLGETKTNDVSVVVGIENDAPVGWSMAGGLLTRLWSAPGKPTVTTLGPTISVRDQSPGDASLVRADFAYTPRYGAFDIDATDPVKIGRLTLAPRLQYAIGAHLPLELTYPLGLGEGFAGLRFDNNRGDREALAAVESRYPIWGAVGLCVELMTGDSQFGGSVVPDGRWLLGARGGVVADTPFGPVRFEYGGASGGQRALFIRLGYWF
ncbi:MAG TPA: patatin-like phospholipase family protein [Gemmatimonadaceae bacterium]|nr:patatin-like phospholipase family protein [Gemmatimonadaceae bacterium]